jgi:hypothetical protein
MHSMLLMYQSAHTHREALLALASDIIAAGPSTLFFLRSRIVFV